MSGTLFTSIKWSDRAMLRNLLKLRSNSHPLLRIATPN